jgi:ribosomal protein L40E
MQKNKNLFSKIIISGDGTNFQIGQIPNSHGISVNTDKLYKKRGTTVQSNVWQYFAFNSECNKSICKLCCAKLSGRIATNCRTHLKSKHKIFLKS